jgi:methylmalonyl-CoA mutase
MTEQTDSSAPPVDSAQKLSFRDDFPPHTYEEWYATAVASLKGASFEKKLLTSTYEGIELQPLYHRQDSPLPHEGGFPGFPPYIRGGNATGYVEAPWAICQELDLKTASSFNDTARADLKRGLDALGVRLGTSTRLCPTAATKASPSGLTLSDSNDFRTAFEGILGETPLHLLAGATALPFLAHLAAVLPEGTPLSQLRGCVGADPLGEQARYGLLARSLETLYDQMAAVTSWAAAKCPDLQTVLVQGCPYHEAGASATQELAFALATGVDYVRALQERELAPATSCGHFRFSFSLGRNFFMEIAKLRAARLLWARIVDAWGGDAAAQRMVIHGRTSWWTKSALDPMVNQLRNTTEALAGVVGGVDSLHVRPFDEPLGPSQELSRRLARNLQLLLLHESHLDWPIDPAGGSRVVEHLTDQLAKQAWELFQQVQGQGGMAASLKAGFPQQEVAAVAQRRRKNLETRRDVMVGANLYPNETDQLEALASDQLRPDHSPQSTASVPGPKAAPSSPELVDWAIERARQGASLATVLNGTTAAEPASNESGNTEIQPLEFHRGSEPYEGLRRAAQTGADQKDGIKVFLASVGPLSQHIARTDFAANFFLVGGFDVLRSDGYPTATAAADAALASDAPVVVICSSDKAYPELVPELTGLIKAQRSKATVILAGKPAPDLEPAYRQAGLDDAIYLGANCFNILKSLQSQQGICHD